jgi:hypothetical protein
MSDLESVLREADRVSKKQKICALTTAECIESLLEKFKEVRSKFIQAGATISAKDSQDLMKNIAKEIDAHTKVASAIKEAHSSISKLGKVKPYLMFSFEIQLFREG